MLLEVILHLRILAGCATMFVVNGNYADVFTSSGVSRMWWYHIAASKLPPSLWVLVDSNRGLDDVPMWVTALPYFVVQAASPRPRRMEWQKKEIHVSWYILKPWSLKEAIAALVVVMCRSI
jgi:hypothetical protein